MDKITWDAWLRLPHHVVFLENGDNLDCVVIKTFRPSKPVTITMDQVLQYAAATGDNQWIHCDVEAATAGPFRGPIAQGGLVLGLVANMAMGSSFCVNDGTGPITMRFIEGKASKPVPVGATIYPYFRFTEAKWVRGYLVVEGEFRFELPGPPEVVVASGKMGLLFWPGNG